MFKELGWKPSSLIALFLDCFVDVSFRRGLERWRVSYLGTSQEAAMFMEKGASKGFWREEEEGCTNLTFS
jgi:hypothetical protein